MLTSKRGKMKIEKQIVMKMDGIYAVNSIVVEKKRKLLIATEKQGECWQVDSDSLEMERVWNGPGGTMAFAGTSYGEEFWAIQNFFPVFDSAHAVVTKVIRYKNEWVTRNCLNLPYIHRIDVIETNLGKFFIGCTLCTEKRSMDDWSSPGAVYVGKISKDGLEIEDVQLLIKDITRNHGYFRNEFDAEGLVYVSCDKGIFEISVPTLEEPHWKVKRIINEPTSDIAVTDIDGDGILEILTIQPFHGNSISVRKMTDGKNEPVWTYQEKSEFGHVAWSGTILGKPAFIAGFRGGKKELLLLTWKKDHFESIEIDREGGPCNIHVYHDETGDRILAANGNTGEAVLYTIKA